MSAPTFYVEPTVIESGPSRIVTGLAYTDDGRDFAVLYIEDPVDGVEIRLNADQVQQLVESLSGTREGLLSHD